LPLLALVAAILGAGLAAARSVTEDARAIAPDFAVVPTGLRVHVIGIDGLDRRMAEQMIAQGGMPRLAELRARGAHAALRAEAEQVPAIVWTTIATGRGRAAHGIGATGTRRLAGMRTPVALGDEGPLARGLASAADLLRLTRAQPATSVLRRAKTFWNVTSDKRLPVGA